MDTPVTDTEITTDAEAEAFLAAMLMEAPIIAPGRIDPQIEQALYLRDMNLSGRALITAINQFEMGMERN